jgi:addiction module RelB/DinJ family antitoxin
VSHKIHKWLILMIFLLTNLYILCILFYMNTTSLHIQIEPVIKQQAQKTADELGLSLSSVVKALLKQFIRTKRLSVGITEEIPNEYLRQSLKQSDEDIKAGRTLSFKSGKDALDYLAREIEDEKRSAH